MTVLRLKVLMVILLLAVIFWPTFLWMNYRFSEAESFYAHGFLVPFVAAWLIFRKKKELLKTTIQPKQIGIVIIIASLILHIFSYYFEINFLSGFALLGTILGFVLYTCGSLVLKQISFPLFFLIFMVPLPQATTLLISFKMKLFAADAAGFLAKLLFGIPLTNSGSLIYLPNGMLAVGNPCSGLKSLITLLALCLLFAHLSGFKIKKKIIFFICTIPIAIMANIIRILLLIIVFYVYGSQIALGWFHDFSGYLLFVIAFIGLALVRKIFLLWPEKWGPMNKSVLPIITSRGEHPVADNYFAGRKVCGHLGSGIDTLLISIFILLLSALSIMHITAIKATTALEENKPVLPASIAEWKLKEETKITDDLLKILGTKAAALGEYTNKNNERFQLYILRSSSRRSSFHQPEYCYTGSGKNELLKRGRLEIKLNNQKPIKVNYLFLHSEKSFQLVCYFYTVNELISSDYYKQQLYFLIKRLKKETVEGLLVRIAKFSSGQNLDEELKNLQHIVESFVTETRLKFN